MRRYANILGNILMLASLAYIFRVLGTMDRSAFDGVAPSVLVKTIVMGLAIQIPLTILVGFGWKLCLEIMTGRKLPFKPLLSVHLISAISKYLPGNVFEFVSRNLLGNKQGIEHKQLFLASVFEAVLGVSVFAALSVGALVGADIPLPATLNLPVTPLLSLMFLLIMGALVCGVPLVAPKASGKIRWRFMLTRSIGFAIVTFIIQAVAATIYLRILNEFAPVLLAMVPVYVVYCFFLGAYFLGYLIPGAPGGIGVREAALLLLLAPYFPQNVILGSAIAMRLVHILSDFIGFFIGKALENKLEKK